MKNLGGMLKQAQQLQSKMQEMQQRMGEIEVEGQSGGGMVKVTVTGRGEVRKINVDASLVDPDEKEVMEDLIVAATNDARVRSEQMMQEEMSKLTGGMQLPPGMKLPF